MSLELVPDVDESGLKLAEQAYAAGAVEPAAIVSTCEVSITFRIRGDRARANLLAQRVALELLTIDGIEPNVVTMATEL